jgi:hypothetical protein
VARYRKSWETVRDLDATRTDDDRPAHLAARGVADPDRLALPSILQRHGGRHDLQPAARECDAGVLAAPHLPWCGNVARAGDTTRGERASGLPTDQILGTA